MSHQYKLSIVVLTWNGGKEAEEFLESFIKYPPTISTQLIIVDNASSDGTIEKLEEFESQKHPKNIKIELVLNNENLGYAKGNNTALPYIKGEYTLFLNLSLIHI